MSGNKYMLSEVMEPQLFVIRKQKKDSPEKVAPVMTWMDQSIKRCSVLAARILTPAPLPPAFPEGYAPPTSEGEKAPEDQQRTEVQLPTVDPIIDQGPSKRMKFLSENQQLSHSLILSVCLPLPCHQPTEFAPFAVKIVSEASEASI